MNPSQISSFDQLLDQDEKTHRDQSGHEADPDPGLKVNHGQDPCEGDSVSCDEIAKSQDECTRCRNQEPRRSVSPQSKPNAQISGNAVREDDAVDEDCPEQENDTTDQKRY